MDDTNDSKQEGDVTSHGQGPSQGEDDGLMQGGNGGPPTGGPPPGSGDPGDGGPSGSPLRAVGVAIGLGLLGILIPFLFIGFVAAIIFALDPPGLPVILVLLVIGQFAWFAVLGVYYLRWRGFEWGDVKSYLGVDRPTLRDIGLIIGTWIVMIIVALVVANLVIQFVPELLGLEDDPEPAENPATEIIAENPELIGAAIAFMLLVVGPTEEILFRGVIQNRLRESMSAIPAILVASAVFAAAHVVALAGQDPVGILMTITILFVPSIGFGAIYEYTGNIVVPSLLHGFHNSMIVLFVYVDAVYDLEPEEATLAPELLSLLPF